MSIYRPGGLELTRYALRQIGAKPGEALLEIGCGDGTAAACAAQEFGQRVVAVDRDGQAVRKARSRGVDARRMDAADLELGGSVFDTAFMECVLSLIEEKERTLRQVCALLRPGGHLIISDVYQKADCSEKREELIDLDQLMCLLDGMGMERVQCEDRTRDLKTFLAQAIMSHGSLEAWFEAEGGWKPCLCQYGKGAGYFLLTVRKKYA